VSESARPADAASGIRIVRFDACEAVPWANGKGTTRVLAVDGADPEWCYRVSVADLGGAQAFSAFPGIHRHLTFLGPGTLEMRIDGATTTLRPFESVEFAGEDAVHSTASSPGARDLNVMSRRGRRPVRERVLDAGAVHPAGDAAEALWIALEPGTIAGAEVRMLDVAHLPVGAPVVASGRGLLVEIGPDGRGHAASDPPTPPD